MGTKVVEMLVTQQGSQNGTIVETFEKGAVVDMEESLAKVFIDNEWAKSTNKRVTADKDDDE